MLLLTSGTRPPLCRVCGTSSIGLCHTHILEYIHIRTVQILEDAPALLPAEPDDACVLCDCPVAAHDPESGACLLCECGHAFSIDIYAMAGAAL